MTPDPSKVVPTSAASVTPGVTPKPNSLHGGKVSKSPVPRIAIWTACILMLIGVGYWTWGRTHSKPSTMITAKVALGDIDQSVTATGSITAQTGAEVHIGSQIAGTVKRLATDVGKKVRAGQLIAELDLPGLQDTLNQSHAALAQAETSYAQQVSGVNQVATQTSSSLAVAKSAVTGAQKLLLVAVANRNLQETQTPTDIRKAKATLATARSVLLQNRADADLEVNTAKEAVAQAQATATNSAINLVSAQSLYSQGFSAKTDLDTARATDGVNQSLVRAAIHNVGLVNQKVAADLQAAADAVGSAVAALAAAEAETQTVLARIADVGNANAGVGQSKANLLAAVANGANDTLKSQDVQKAKQAVAQAKAVVAFNEAEMSKSMIRSPISGTVLQLSTQQGETVSAGLATQTLITVTDLDRLEVDTFVDETDIGKVAIGQSAQYTIGAFPNKTFTGKVVKIASGSTIQQSVVTYDVTISIQKSKFLLKPDMTTNVVINTGHLTGVVIVPAVAVQLTTAGSSLNVLRSVNGKEQVVSTRVVTGATDGLNMQILSGIKVGDVVVLAGGAPKAAPSTGSSPFGQSRGGPGGR